MKVFVADDSAMVRRRLVSLISEVEGVELVGQTGDASDALEAIRRLKPDVVILDIRMPGGNGIEALKAIKKEPGAPVVIMLTAFPYRQYHHKCLEAGADYFFDKVTQFDAIPQTLKRLQARAERGPSTPIQNRHRGD